MKKLISLLLFSFCPMVIATESASVFIKNQQDVIGFINPPRLSVVINALTASDKHIYWPQAKLYLIDSKMSEELQSQKNRVLADLSVLIMHWHENQQLASDLSSLHREIESWEFGLYINSPLDADLVNLDRNYDPVLDKGNYLFIGGRRKNLVSLIALGGKIDVVYESSKPVFVYLEQAGFSESATDIDDVFLVPNKSNIGSVSPRKLPVSHWNRTIEPLPIGAVVYVPLSASVHTDQFPNLNEQILQLAQYRIIK
jgi:hypothetical protein